MFFLSHFKKPLSLQPDIAAPSWWLLCTRWLQVTSSRLHRLSAYTMGGNGDTSSISLDVSGKQRELFSSDEPRQLLHCFRFKDLQHLLLYVCWYHRCMFVFDLQQQDSAWQRVPLRLPFAGHTPAIRQAAKQTDEVNRERERCFLASSETWLRQSQTPTLDTAWQPTVVGHRRGAHMITRQIMFVSGDSEVTALENGGVDLTVQSCCSPQIIVACFYRGVAVSSFHLPCGGFNLWDEPWPQGQNPIT